MIYNPDPAAQGPVYTQFRQSRDFFYFDVKDIAMKRKFKNILSKIACALILLLGVLVV
jgi:outer membrane protein OmpA-like peptidoglycan-associated protein